MDLNVPKLREYWTQGVLDPIDQIQTIDENDINTEGLSPTVLKSNC